MSAISFRLGLSEKRNHRRPVYVFWHGLAAFFFSSVRWSNGDENPLRGKYGGTGAALWDVFSFLRPKYSSDHMTTTHTTGTRVGIHTCACSRVKGSLREHERVCALNAWRAIPLILASSHPSPPTFLQPILLPISPLAKWLHFMELQECGGFCRCCCLLLGYAGKLPFLFLLLTLWLLPLIIYSTGDLKDLLRRFAPPLVLPTWSPPPFISVIILLPPMTICPF